MKRENREPQVQQLTAISLYTGAGGLDIGVEEAGFDISVAVEMDKNCVKTLRENRNWPIIDESIHDVSSRQILRTAGLSVGEVDLLVGGPPCQPFSKSGYWATGDTRRLDDPRADTLAAFLRVLKDTQPRAMLMENVTGLAYSKKNEGFQFIQAALEKINQELGTRYVLELLRLNAVDYGVPQKRARVFLLAAREGALIHNVRPSHADLRNSAPELDEDNGSLPYVNTWDVLWDLEDTMDGVLQPTGKWADLLPSIPEGKNYQHHTERGGGLPMFGWRRRYWNFLLKLAKSEPSWTLTAQPGPATGPFHWRNRRLSVREMCRLQTIPDDYQISGDYRCAVRQIGNAVPSALAEYVALSIRAGYLDDDADILHTRKLVPSKSDSVPPPEEVLSVPKKYLQYVGTDTEHPGTGLGRRASVRKPKGAETE